MNEHDKETQENKIDEPTTSELNLPVEEGEDSDSDDLDIEAALASISSLDDALAEHVAAEEEEAQRMAAETAAAEQFQEALRMQAQERAAYQLPHPPVITALQRGQFASAIPALLLMAIGMWLTFVLTTSDTAPSIGAVVVVILGAGGITMLSYWLLSRRWARGALFTGLILLFFAVVLGYFIQSNGANADQWPLFIVALALAVLLSAFLSPPVGEGHVLLGIIVGVAGLAALATMTVLSDAVLDVARAFSPAVLVLVLVIFLLPRIPKRNS